MRAFINIERQTLLDNLERVMNQCYPKKLFIVLKANAYGHGLQEMARLFSGVKNPSFVVATLEEAMMVRKALVFNPLLLLENTSDYKTCANLRLHVAVHSLRRLRELSEKHLALPIHLNINTGLNRDGLEPSEVREAADILRKSSLRLKGLYTHHSAKEAIDRENGLFRSLIGEFSDFPGLLIHSGASSSLDYKDDFTNAVRIGGSVYGLCPLSSIKVSPALELLAPIWNVRPVARGENVGYGSQDKAPADGFLYLLPLGYKDGFPRVRKAIGWCGGEILVEVGQTMMDHMIMFSKKKFDEGQTVEMMGHNLDVFSLAKLYKTIPYELCATLHERLKRNYI